MKRSEEEKIGVFPNFHRPLTLGEDLDKEVQAYLLNLREVGGVYSKSKSLE